MLSLPPTVRVFIALDATDMRKSFGAPGQAWRFQRVRFPPRQEERAASPGIESWAHGGNDMGQA